MSPEERAKALWEDDDAFEKCDPNDSLGRVWIRVVASAIREAENDALERAAANVCNGKRTPPSEWALAKAYAARIRSLKSPSPRGGEGEPTP